MQPGDVTETFADVAELMRDIEANPHAILQAVDDYLHDVPSYDWPVSC